MKKNKTKKFFGGREYIPKYIKNNKELKPIVSISEIQRQELERERRELVELRNRTRPLSRDPISQEEIDNIFPGYRRGGKKRKTKKNKRKSKKNKK